MIFLKNIENQPHLLDTIIQKRIMGEYTYIMAIGLSRALISDSPRDYNQFCGKFKWDEDEEMTIGVFSNQHDPEEWIHKCIEDEIDDEEFFPLEEQDSAIIKEMSSHIWNEYITHVEDTNDRVIKSNYIEKLEEHINGAAKNYYEVNPPKGFFWTDDWNDEIVHFISCVKDIWGLDYHLPNSF